MAILIQPSDVVTDDREGLYLHKCSVCNWSGRTKTTDMVMHACHGEKNNRLGEALESFLTSHGITKEWSAALRANGHREPECKHRGIESGQPLKVSCSCSDTGEKIETVHQCDIESIRRCLPHFHPNNKDRKSWAERKPESDIYRLCDACQHFKAKE